jgi:8-oxo-dGTP pyrophosphatase MutT (NUDIX family)
MTSRSEDQPYLVPHPAGYLEYQLPISLKAVILWRGCVPLLKNERDEWELPGGKLEVDEDPASALEREIGEELGWDATVARPYHAWVYKIRPDRHVFVLTYLAEYAGDKPPVYSHEHKALTLVPVDEVRSLNMPDPYKDAIEQAVKLSRP